MCHSRCPTATHLNGSPLTKVSHCCCLRWLHVISGVLLPLTGMTACHSKCFAAAYWSGSVSLQVFQCHSLDVLCHAKCPTVLTGVAICHPGFPIFSFWGDSMSFHLSHCYFLWWLCVITGFYYCSPGCFCGIPGVLLPLSGVCSASFCVSHYSSLG